MQKNSISHALTEWGIPRVTNFNETEKIVHEFIGRRVWFEHTNKIVRSKNGKTRVFENYTSFLTNTISTSFNYKINVISFSHRLTQSVAFRNSFLCEEIVSIVNPSFICFKNILYLYIGIVVSFVIRWSGVSGLSEITPLATTWPSTFCIIAMKYIIVRPYLHFLINPTIFWY